MISSDLIHPIFMKTILWFLYQTKKEIKNAEIRERINSDPILKSLNLDFGVDFNRLLAFHGDFEIGDLGFDDFSNRIYSLMEILNLEPSTIGVIVERNPLILKNNDFNCIQRWNEITDFLSEKKTLFLHKNRQAYYTEKRQPNQAVNSIIVRNPIILNNSVPDLRRNIAFYMSSNILNPPTTPDARVQISTALIVEPSLLTQPIAYFERVMNTLSMYGLADDQLRKIFFENTPGTGFQ